MAKQIENQSTSNAFKQETTRHIQFACHLAITLNLAITRTVHAFTPPTPRHTLTHIIYTILSPTPTRKERRNDSCHTHVYFQLITSYFVIHEQVIRLRKSRKIFSVEVIVFKALNNNSTKLKISPLIFHRF